MTLTQAVLPLLLTISAFGPSVMAQSADTATAHKAAATALLNSNNTGGAHLACPATIGETPAANSPAGPGRGKMPSPEKDRLAAEAMECWADFQAGLSSDKRKYPIQQFKAFWAVTKRYAELTKSDPLIHRSLAAAVNGLVDFLEVERKGVPGQVLRDAERLELPPL
jgi:hypothetical protein